MTSIHPIPFSAPPPAGRPLSAPSGGGAFRDVYNSLPFARGQEAATDTPPVPDQGNVTSDTSGQSAQDDQQLIDEPHLNHGTELHETVFATPPLREPLLSGGALPILLSDAFLTGQDPSHGGKSLQIPAEGSDETAPDIPQNPAPHPARSPHIAAQVVALEHSADLPDHKGPPAEGGTNLPVPARAGTDSPPASTGHHLAFPQHHSAQHSAPQMQTAVITGVVTSGDALHLPPPEASLTEQAGAHPAAPPDIAAEAEPKAQSRTTDLRAGALHREPDILSRLQPGPAPRTAEPDVQGRSLMLPVLPQASKGATPDPIVLTGDIGPPVSLRDLPTAENRFDLQLTALKTDNPTTQAAAPPQALRSSPGLPDQILTALRKLENNEIELQLDPPELGGLRITLKTEGELAQVRFAADRPETMDLLRRSRGDLQEGLNEQGFSHVSFSFEGRDHEDPGPEQAGQPPPSALRPDDNPLHAAATAVRQGSDGLDLRL